MPTASQIPQTLHDRMMLSRASAERGPATAMAPVGAISGTRNSDRTASARFTRLEHLRAARFVRLRAINSAPNTNALDSGITDTQRCPPSNPRQGRGIKHAACQLCNTSAKLSGFWSRAQSGVGNPTFGV